MCEWVSMKDRPPRDDGEYLVAWRSRHTRAWVYMLDEWDDGWYQDGADADVEITYPRVEFWLDFPRIGD